MTAARLDSSNRGVTGLGVPMNHRLVGVVHSGLTSESQPFPGGRMAISDSTDPGRRAERPRARTFTFERRYEPDPQRAGKALLVVLRGPSAAPQDQLDDALACRSARVPRVPADAAQRLN